MIIIVGKREVKATNGNSDFPFFWMREKFTFVGITVLNQYFSSFALLTRNRVWGKGYWVWVKGFFFSLSHSPFPLNRKVLGFYLFPPLRVSQNHLHFLKIGIAAAKSDRLYVVQKNCRVAPLCYPTVCLI